MNMVLDIRMERALALAARGHHGVSRKGTDTPYITHPFHVAMILKHVGAPPDVVLAGILHDTLEDTSVTREQIAQEVGPRVAELVEAVTQQEPDEKKGLTWHQVKQAALDHLAAADADVALLKCADTFHNVSTLEAAGPSAWKRFSRPATEVLWYYGGVARLCGQKLGAAHPLAAGLLDVITRLEAAQR